MTVQSSHDESTPYTAWQTELERTTQRIHNLTELVAESN